MQVEAVPAIASGDQPETVFLLEHPHVFTIGRRGAEENLISNVDFDGSPLNAVRINRGGDITYHGPGQLVGYPLLDLNRRSKDLHRFLRDLEECLIRVAADYGVSAYRKEGLTGAWTDSGKLASIGIGVRQWVTMHGFALNVLTDLRYFQLINPCGMPGCPMVSLSQLSSSEVKMTEVKECLERHFRQLFSV